MDYIAPSAPRNLNLLTTSVTSKSALIRWEPPAIRNGELTIYTIYWQVFCFLINNFLYIHIYNEIDSL